MDYRLEYFLQSDEAKLFFCRSVNQPIHSEVMNNSYQLNKNSHETAPQLVTNGQGFRYTGRK
jgi:hypothetical protein